MNSFTGMSFFFLTAGTKQLFFNLALTATSKTKMSRGFFFEIGSGQSTEKVEYGEA